MNFILIAVLVLGAIALIAALVLFGVFKKFAVEEDPRLGQVGEILPGANCGGCGFAGCSGMAAALVKGADAGSIDGLMYFSGLSIVFSIRAMISPFLRVVVATTRMSFMCFLLSPQIPLDEFFEAFLRDPVGVFAWLGLDRSSEWEEIPLQADPERLIGNA